MNSAARRIRAATVRTEQKPYRFKPQEPRAPRLGPPSGHYWCALSTTIAAATGSVGSRTPGTLASQTVYSTATGSDVALPGTYTIKNWWPTSFPGSKTTLLLPAGNGAFDLAEQAC
jgi:hypothetical protein